LGMKRGVGASGSGGCWVDSEDAIKAYGDMVMPPITYILS